MICSLTRCARIAAAIACGIAFGTVLLGLGTALKQTTRLDGAPTQARLALVAVDGEMRDQAHAGSATAESLRREHALFVGALARLQAALRDEPALGDPSIAGAGLIPSFDVLESVGDARAREARWWGIRLTGHAVAGPPPDCAAAGSDATSQLVCQVLDGASADQQTSAIAAGNPDPTGDRAAAAQDMARVSPAVDRAQRIAARDLTAQELQAAVFVVLAIVLVSVWLGLRGCVLRANADRPVVKLAASLGPRRGLAQRAPYAIGGVATYSLLAVCAAAVFLHSDNMFALTTRLACLCVGLLGLLLAIPLWRKCRIGARPDAATALALDGRAPVLYMRSEGDAEATEIDDATDDNGLVNTLSKDESLARLLRKTGPVITLAPASESNPPIGMSTIGPASQARPAALDGLLAQSRLVLLHVSGPADNAHALESAVNTIDPERLVLLLAGNASLPLTVEYLNGVLPHPLAALAHRKASPAAWVRFVVYFLPDWSPIAWEIPQDSRGLSLMSALTAALRQPVRRIHGALAAPWVAIGARRALPLLASLIVIGYAVQFWKFVHA